MDTTFYSSRQEAITRKAKEKGVSLADLNTVFEQKIDAIVQEHPGTKPGWRLGRAEYLVWEHFFHNEPFPGAMEPSVGVKKSDGGLSRKNKNVPPPSTKETMPVRLQDLDSYRLMDKIAMTSDWIHDKYQAELPGRNVNIENRKPDYYNGSAARPFGPTDSYKPSARSNDYHKGDSRDFHSYRPSFRGAEERDAGRYGVNKPTVYASLHDYIVKKAFAAGISSASYHDAYYLFGEKAKEEKPYASAYWLLWRQECMIWKEFFPDEGFIGAEPKFKPTTLDTEPIRFFLMNGNQLERSFRSSPTYGRLTQEANLIPKGPSNVLKELGTSTPALIRKGAKEKSLYLSQAHLIDSKARARKIPPESLLAAYDERQKLVASRFPGESKDWHRWFVEASVWGRLFKDTPFPGREPRSDCALRSGDSKDCILSYSPQEKAMEQMALREGIRKEFFQFLNTTRHDAIAVYPLCTCYARNFLADRLTWRKFFKEPFPVAGPHQEHSISCRVNPQHSPNFSQAQTKGSLKPSSAKSEAVVPGPQSSKTAIKAPATHANNTLVSVESQHLPSRSAGHNQPPATSLRPPVTQPQFSSNHVRSHTAAFNFSSSSPNSILNQAPAPCPIPQVQGNQVHSTFGWVCPQLLHNQGPQLANLKAQNTDTHMAPTVIPLSPVRGTLEKSPPTSILGALAEMRTSRQIPEGAVVMQNMDATICNSDFVAQMLQCLQSEDPASIDSISNGLKCHFRYRGRLNGDLLLWIEPFTAGDTSAFTGGHLFIRGWVQRNLGFGIVALSFYWNEIRNTASFKQTSTTPTSLSEALSPMKSDGENGSLPSMTLDSVKEASGEKIETSIIDAVLIIRGVNVEKIPCSRAALKNLTFSFVIDSCKNKVEEGLQCNFSLTEPEGGNKHDGRGLALIVEPFWGKGREELKKATHFVRAWALHAMKPTPCKASAFLVAPEGLHILGKSSATPAEIEAGHHLGGCRKHEEQPKSPFSASDLDHMLAEETAKAEGSSRLVVDEVTGQVITVRELLKKTLYRASAKTLVSSAMLEEEGIEDDEDDDDGYIPITGTDGDMKDMGGGKLVVVASSMDFELSGGNRFSAIVDGRDVAEKAIETVEQIEERALVGVDVDTAETGGNGGTRPAAIPLENGSGVVETSEPANGKRKAEEDKAEDRAGKKVCC